ncbi:MAG: GntR family transcriptional regulator [Spirochaetales bacterium]|nr:GntR family transcriptional regulator [Spirochaetales bacterium]
MNTSGRERRSAVDFAYESIREAIVNMEISPGEYVSESSLAKRLGVSRTPVRDAIKRLEEDGLIVSERHRKRIYILRIKEIEEIFDLKVSIEGDCMYLAVQRKTAEQGTAFAALLEEIRTFKRSNDFSSVEPDHQLIYDWLELDNRFHDLVFEMCGNPKARRIIHQLNAQWHRLRLGILAMEGRFEKSIEEHLGMGEMLLRDEADRAKELMIMHLNGLRSTFVNIMRLFNYPT